MYQYTVIVGNVGRDPEMKYTQGGVAVCNFSVAVNRRWTDKNTNEQREKTTWFKVACWRGLAETVNQYVYKGMRVLVTGEVDASAWTDNDGNPRASLEITARDVKFLSRRDEDTAAGYGKEGDYGPPPNDLQDIPF